jgi:hypothetical protein
MLVVRSPLSPAGATARARRKRLPTPYPRSGLGRRGTGGLLLRTQGPCVEGRLRRSIRQT